MTVKHHILGFILCISLTVRHSRDIFFKEERQHSIGGPDIYQKDSWSFRSEIPPETKVCISPHESPCLHSHTMITLTARLRPGINYSSLHIQQSRHQWKGKISSTLPCGPPSHLGDISHYLHHHRVVMEASFPRTACWKSVEDNTVTGTEE